MKACNFLLFFCSFLISLFASSAEAASPERLQQITKAFLEEKLYDQLPTEDHAGVKVRIRHINRNLNLAKCDKPLTLQLQGQSIQRNASVKVSCTSDRPWSLYVNGTIVVEKEVVTIRHGLPRHHVLEKDDLTFIKKDMYSLRGGYSTQTNLIVGQQLKRALRSGDVIYSYHLQAPDIIKKGDLVTMVAKRGSLAVMSSGIALSDASKGESLKVENRRSSRIVHTKVIGPATVEVL
ncbi:MAG: flagellar basal body P-ring formation chaperone FlgA [Cellvibrionaceae bacterium]